MQNPFQIAMQNGENSAEPVRGALVWRFRASCQIGNCAERAQLRQSHASFWIVMRQKRARGATRTIQNGASQPVDTRRGQGLSHVRRTIRAGPEK
jgi:hypothetical protein